MELLRLKCPSCGAELPPRAPTGTIQCDYCQSSFQASQVRQATTIAGQQMDAKAIAKAIVEAQQEMATQRQSDAFAQAHAHAAQARKGASRMAMITGGIALLITVVAGIIPMLIVDKVVEGTGLPNISGSIAKIPGVPGIPDVGQVGGDRLTWDTSAGQIQTLRLAGEPGFLGRTREVLNGDNLFFDAFDANSVTRKWRIGPVGTFSQGYRSSFAKVVGNRVVVSDHTAKLYLHDTTDGKELKSFTLSDKVEELCVPEPSNGHEVWVAQVDDRNHMLDTEAATLTEAERPKSCEKRAHSAKPKKLAPEVKGFKAERVHVDGDTAVAAGSKSPGTAYPRAVGFDPETKEVRWEQEIASVDRSSVRERSNPAEGLASGRFISIYGSGQDFWHLTAFDATSGTRLWETQLRPIFAVDRVDDVLVTETHVFVTRTSSLEVFDASNGKLLGTIGSETYEK